MNQLPNNSLFYNGTPIRRIESLAKALGVTIHRLRFVAATANRHWRVAKVVDKDDGTKRITYDADPLLKDIHRRVKRNILDRVQFPPYLTGSIKGQDYKTNATLHTGSVIVIAEDIGSFFPSTTDQHVYNVWRNFFGFSHEVSECLTLLTTLNGQLPQGGVTSPQLANLVFWRHEPILQSKLQSEGLTYSRFVDDVAVSSKTILPDTQKTEVISQIFGMILREGFKPKRSKHELSTSRGRMTVTTLTVNTKPSLSKEARSRVRAAVHRVELLAKSVTEVSSTKEFLSALGKVNNLGRFHKHEAAQLKARLMLLKKITLPIEALESV